MCEYCRGEMPVFTRGAHEEGRRTELRIGEENKLNMYVDGHILLAKPVNYCPMCGHALHDAADPLTLAELERMHGEPIWFLDHRRQGWALQSFLDDFNIFCILVYGEHSSFFRHKKWYGNEKSYKGWIAYAKKPAVSHHSERAY